jgi:site-specific recombinase XerD
MNLLQQFSDFLLNQKKRPSLSTVKNYIADVDQFIVWFEKFYNLNFDPSKISPQILYDYKKSSTLSGVSMKRHLSSLRKFFNFLKTKAIITFELFPSLDQQKIIPDPWMLRNFKNFLYESKRSRLTIKNYVSDIKSFFLWLKQSALTKHNFNVPDEYLLNIINYSVIEQYKQGLIRAKFSPKTINRRLSSLRSYTSWANKQGFTENPDSNLQTVYRDLPTNSLPTHKGFWHFVRYARPKWYGQYHSYVFTNYFHFALFTIFICIVGLGMYENLFVTDAQKENAVLGALVTPSTNQELANSTEMLQGLGLINNSSKDNNVVLALDSSGNLNIPRENTHTFSVVDGKLILSGRTLSLTTSPGSNGNVRIMPDGTGEIDLTKPIQNSTNNNNLTSASGSVEFDDTVSILATNSVQSALYIEQNSAGPLISANTGETAKFILENNGTGMFAGDLAVNGANLTSSSSNFNLLNSVATLNIGSQATAINLGVLGGNTTIKSNLILSSLSSNGGVLYTNTSGEILQTTSSAETDCLIGGHNPSFAPCSKILNQADTVGIGTTNPLFKLDVQDLQDATAAAQIYNTSTNPNASGLIIKLGNLSASISATNHFINFETDGIGIVGSVQGNGAGAGVSYVTGGIADFAEYLKKDQNQSIPFGSVVCLDSTGSTIACDSDNNKVIGVASEHPAFLGGNNLGNGSISVGLTGQIETLVTDKNGEIKAGDTLTASDIPGIAIKATKAGQIIGKALENLTADESKIVGYYDPDNKEYRSKDSLPNIPLKANIVRIYEIPALIDVSWYDPSAYLAQDGQLTIQKTNSNNIYIPGIIDDALTNIGSFFEVMAANIKADLINVSEIVTNTLIVTSDSVMVNGQNLRDYIANVIKDYGIKSEIISPIVDTDQLSANIISPLSSSDLTVKLATPSGSLIVENAGGSVVAGIDDQGNASFSGTLSGLSLQAGNASVSGTLHASNIIADSITGLDAKISNLYSTNFVNLASYSAQLSHMPDFSANQAQLNQGLMVFGPTSLSDLALSGQFSIGSTMFITKNSVETLGTDLTLQSLRQAGLSIMGGLVYINTEGNIQVQGNLSVMGNLVANTISPLPTSDLTVNNANGSAVLSVNQAGDVIASGSGTFSKLNLNFVQPVMAISPTEILASSSAGIADISPYQAEVTINNALVNNKSIIYITPVGTPSAQTPFLMRQTPRSFTVGVQSPTDHSIEFNWLIIN